MEFSHYSVLLNECIEALNIAPDGIYVEGTAGGKGAERSEAYQHWIWQHGLRRTPHRH